MSFGGRKSSADTWGQRQGHGSRLNWCPYDTNVLRLFWANIGRMSPEPRSDAHDGEYIREKREELIIYQFHDEAARRGRDAKPTKAMTAT